MQINIFATGGSTFHNKKETKVKNKLKENDKRRIFMSPRAQSPINRQLNMAKTID
jgi:hypothetical protein